MYFTRGWLQSEIGDVDVIAHEDRLHLFHLCLPNHDMVAHLVSDDGIRWERLPNAIHVGEPGEFDDDQIWTMHTFRFNDRFYMLYTALCSAEKGRIQRTGLAVSDDLVRWEKVPHNPVAEPDGRWYESDTSDSGRADWRDPFAWIEDGVIHAFICAHENKGPYNRRGCVAHITSTDGLHWKVQPPFYTPRISSDFEVPTLMKLGDKYYLVGHIIEPNIDIWRVADSFEGPYRRPPNDILLHAGNCAFCPVVRGDETLMFHWTRAQFDWIGNEVYGRAIAPPKSADTLEDGTLVLRSYRAGWKALSAGKPETLSPRDICTQDASYLGEWSVSGTRIIGECEPGMGLLRLPGIHTDFVLELKLNCYNATGFGVLWRSDETADESTRVFLIPGRMQLELHKITRRVRNNIIGRGHVTVQENHCRLSPGKPCELRVVAYGPYVEVSVDDRVLLSVLTMTRRKGNIALFVEDGTASFESVRLTELKAPDDFPV